MLSTILGGIGLFLLGMILLTEGLKALAGDSLRGFLARFTGGRFKSLAAGATIPAVVQSSSATTLTTIGFVSAGLLSFQQSVGVILGANLGTTSTGWLVSLLGLKFSIVGLALPLIGLGALTRLLARGRFAHVGLALAGFGLIFVGIDTLQAGMEGLAARMEPRDFPDARVGGRLLLVLIGIVMTVVMQSSSAAVATTLTALHTGTVGLDQAAALVIGQNVGTTVTAVIAAIGATVAAKRTALAHTLFNVLTGVLAFIVLPWAVDLLDMQQRVLETNSPAILLAEFHTAFNLLGVLVFLPFLGAFSDLVVRLIPDRGPQLTKHLGRLVARGPLAVDAAGLTMRVTFEETVRVLREVMGRGPPDRVVAERLGAVEDALIKTRDYLAGIRSEPESGTHGQRHVALLHSLDHMERLVEALRDCNHLAEVREESNVHEVLDALERAASACALAIEGGAHIPHAVLEVESKGIAASRKQHRPGVLESAAHGGVSPARAGDILETVRWIDRLAYHLWRAAYYLFLADPTSISDASLPSWDQTDLESAVP